MDSQDIFEEKSGMKNVKIRKIDKLNTGGSPNSSLKKPLLKDLRVSVQRLSTEGNSDQLEKVEKEEKEDSSMKRAKSEERQVPHLPVAEDEPAREISSSCPQGLKKEGSQEDMVTSSSQEPRTKCVLIQTEQVQSEVSPAKVICKDNYSKYK